MLVAMPSAIAFGGYNLMLTMGESYAAYGAIAGILGVAIYRYYGVVDGGTHRLISAPVPSSCGFISICPQIQ